MKQKVAALFSALVLLFIPAGYGKAGGQSSMYAQAENWAYLETDKTAAADVFFYLSHGLWRRNGPFQHVHG